MQNRAICALPFDWDRTFLCGACDSFVTKTVARKNLCNYGYAFDVASVSLFCVRHAEPRDMRAAI